MAILGSSRIQTAAEKRFTVAVLVSLVVHGVVISSVGISSREYSQPSPLRARIVPLSLPDALRIDSALSEAAPAELNASSHIAPRHPDERGESGATAAMIPERDRPAPAGVSAELPIYYTNEEVDVRATPRLMANGSRAEKSLLLGRVVKLKLRLYIGDDGGVDNFDILQADGLTPSVVIDDIRDLKFNPAQRGGRPVKSLKVVELTFVP
jgi:hypothetical protein